MWASQERRLLMFLSSCCTATRVSLSFFVLLWTIGYESDTQYTQHYQNRLIFLMQRVLYQVAHKLKKKIILIMNGKRELFFSSVAYVVLPRTDEVEQVLPAITDLDKFVFYF